MALRIFQFYPWGNWGTEYNLLKAIARNWESQHWIKSVWLCLITLLKIIAFAIQTIMSSTHLFPVSVQCFHTSRCLALLLSMIPQYLHRFSRPLNRWSVLTLCLLHVTVFPFPIIRSWWRPIVILAAICEPKHGSLLFP